MVTLQARGRSSKQRACKNSVWLTTITASHAAVLPLPRAPVTTAEAEVDAVGEAEGDAVLDTEADGEAVVDTLLLAEDVDVAVAVGDPLGDADMDAVDVADALPVADAA